VYKDTLGMIYKQVFSRLMTSRKNNLDYNLNPGFHRASIARRPEKFTVRLISLLAVF